MATIAFPEIGLTFYKGSRDISNSCSALQTPGRFCENCAQLSTCVNLGNSNWLSVPVETCNSERGLFCYNGYCSSTESDCNQWDIPFTCNTGGVFPDPYDCQTYHFCYADGSGELVKITSVCSGDSAFSAASGDCSAHLSDDVCHRQFICGYMDAWPGNSNIFYVCTIFTNKFGREVGHPELFRCDAGLSFSDGICA